MSILSSSAAFDGPVQADGRRQVREVHVASDGNDVVMTYFASPEDNIQAIAAARASSVLARLAENEAMANVERDGPFTPNHQTGTQFAARFRAMVLAATRERACYLAWWLTRRIAAGDTSDSAVRSAFGLTAAAWTSFKAAQVKPRADAWAAVLASTGV